MATLLLKKSYQLSNLKEVDFKDLWDSAHRKCQQEKVPEEPELRLRDCDCVFPC